MVSELDGARVGANCLDLDWGPLHLNFGSILTEELDSGYSDR